MTDSIEIMNVLKKFYNDKLNALQNEYDCLMAENERLKEENKQLECKFLNMFIENDKLVKTFDRLDEIMRDTVKK